MPVLAAAGRGLGRAASAGSELPRGPEPSGLPPGDARARGGCCSLGTATFRCIKKPRSQPWGAPPGLPRERLGAGAFSRRPGPSPSPEASPARGSARLSSRRCRDCLRWGCRRPRDFRVRGARAGLAGAAAASFLAVAAERALVQAPDRLRVLLNTGPSVQETSMPLSYCVLLCPESVIFFSVPSLLSF